MILLKYEPRESTSPVHAQCVYMCCMWKEMAFPGVFPVHYHALLYMYIHVSEHDVVLLWTSHTCVRVLSVSTHFWYK